MFFLPLFDNNPTNRTPIITRAIIIACILVFLYQIGLTDRLERLFIFSYGAIPALITGAEIRPGYFSDIPDKATLFTSIFMHGGLLHLGGNMLYLWIFGDNVEDSMGPVRFTLFYLACGVAATLTHIAIDPSSVTPLVGASGAIAGVLAAYLMLYPHAEVRVMIVILIFVRWASFPAVAVLAGWLIIQFLSAPASLSSDGGGVAYFAHIGGFVAGLILTPFMRQSSHPIFPAKEKETRESDRLTVLNRQAIKNAFVERYRRPVFHAKTANKKANAKVTTDHIRRSRRHLPNVKSSHRKQDEDK
jgi:membrane associated rhomboid family serine protease